MVTPQEGERERRMKRDFHEFVRNMKTGDADTRAMFVLTVMNICALLAHAKGWI